LLNIAELVLDLPVLPSAYARVNKQVGRNIVVVLGDAASDTLIDRAHDTPAAHLVHLEVLEVFSQKRPNDLTRVLCFARVNGLLSTPSPMAFMFSYSEPKCFEK
jgi:hypothetical protein